MVADKELDISISLVRMQLKGDTDENFESNFLNMAHSTISGWQAMPLLFLPTNSGLAILVGEQGIEPWTSSLSEKRSTTEPLAQNRVSERCFTDKLAAQSGGAEGNRTLASRFCRPQRFHFATAPI